MSGLCLLLVGWLMAANASAPVDAGSTPDSDGGTVTASDDREVIDNLDLLQTMDQSADLDLLIELSKE